jgi:hypothetical protein
MAMPPIKEYKSQGVRLLFFTLKRNNRILLGLFAPKR